MSHSRLPLRFVAALALGVLATGATFAQTAFKIGQPAPEFKAGRWLKHGPITELEPGKIHVLEFWATWCGPCRAAMPHLTELAKKHAGKVTVIGVNIWEKATGEKAEKMVDRFVSEMGQDLDYPTCRDTADEHLLNHWMKPTKSGGIPTTIVVDAQGRIAWIGHPINLDPVIDDLLAGRFDYEKSSAEFTKKSTENEAMGKVFAEYADAMKARDYVKAIAVADNHPEYAAAFWLLRFRALLHVDAAEALEQAKRVVAQKERGAGSYLQCIVIEDDLPRALYEFVAETLTREHQPGELMTLAKAVYRLGDSAKALEYQLRFKEHFLSQQKQPNPAVIEMIEADIKKYREGK